MSYEMTQPMTGSVAVKRPGFRADLPDEVVKSAARTLQILEYFDHVRREVSITEIASALNFPQSSTSALLRSMVVMGYLRHDRTARSYSLTRRTGLVGAWVDNSLVRQGAVVTLVNCLAEHSKETVLLARQNERKVQVIYVADGSGDAFATVGNHIDLERSATGNALMAMQENGMIRRLIARLNADRDPDTAPVDTAAKIAEIEAGRRLGVFTGPGSSAGLISVAARLRHEAAGDTLVIAVEGPEHRIKDRIAAISGLLNTGLKQLSS